MLLPSLDEPASQTRGRKETSINTTLHDKIGKLFKQISRHVFGLDTLACLSTLDQRKQERFIMHNVEGMLAWDGQFEGPNGYVFEMHFTMNVKTFCCRK